MFHFDENHKSTSHLNLISAHPHQRQTIAVLWLLLFSYSWSRRTTSIYTYIRCDGGIVFSKLAKTSAQPPLPSNETLLIHEIQFSKLMMWNFAKISIPNKNRLILPKTWRPPEICWIHMVSGPNCPTNYNKVVCQVQMKMINLIDSNREEAGKTVHTAINITIAFQPTKKLNQRAWHNTSYISQAYLQLHKSIAGKTPSNLLIAFKTKNKLNSLWFCKKLRAKHIQITQTK